MLERIMEDISNPLGQLDFKINIYMCVCVCFPSQTSVLDIKGNLRVHIDIVFIKDIRTKFVTT
jgi:hypothetical protein